MFDTFGEFDTAEEINELAVNLRKEGDLESIRVLAAENGIDREVADLFISGDLLYLADDMTAAIGKIDMEAGELKPVEIMADWTEYIRAQCFGNEEMARAVRRRNRSLKECIAVLLKWSFAHQQQVDKDIIRAAGVTAGRVTLGIPGMGTAKRAIREYYLGVKK